MSWSRVWKRATWKNSSEIGEQGAADVTMNVNPRLRDDGG
jgi:hypothetical protein